MSLNLGYLKNGKTIGELLEEDQRDLIEDLPMRMDGGQQ
jgi:hypothetical protein